ncbi:MAG TPA: c-type cytochrome [Kofleriaceae bacterium]|nr:c-type cytochrome [Kofleriaceae bacterium]
MTRLLPGLLALVFACGGRSEAEPAAPAGGHAGHEHPQATPPADPGTPPGETPADPDQAKADLLAAEAAALEKARPVFDKHCARCHTKGGKNARPKTLEHFDMSSYPFGGHHAGEIAGEIREVLAIGGGKPSMPADKPGAVSGDELALIAAWADACEKSHGAGAHQGHGHGDDHDHGGGHKH